MKRSFRAANPLQKFHKSFAPSKIVFSASRNCNSTILLAQILSRPQQPSAAVRRGAPELRRQRHRKETGRQKDNFFGCGRSAPQHPGHEAGAALQPPKNGAAAENDRQHGRAGGKDDQFTRICAGTFCTRISVVGLHILLFGQGRVGSFSVL